MITQHLKRMLVSIAKNPHTPVCVYMCIFFKACFKIANDAMLAKEQMSCGLLYSPAPTYNSRCHKYFTNPNPHYTDSKKILVYWTEFSTMSQKPKPASGFLVSTVTAM